MTNAFPAGLKRSAAMIILQHQDSFMLLKRNKEPHVGKYVPVGGKLEPFEDPYRAALRELHEETGLLLDHLNYAGHLIETSPLAYNWQCNIYWANIDFVPPPYCPEGILEWVPFHLLREIPTPATDWHIYQFLREKRPFAINAIYDQNMNLVSMTEDIAGENLI